MKSVIPIQKENNEETIWIPILPKYYSGTYTRDSTGTTINIGFDATYTYRGYIEFNISSIPDIADIEDITLNLTFTSLGTYNCDINQIEAQPSSNSSDQNLYDDIANGTTYINNNNFCASSSGNFYPSLDLGSNTDFDFQDNLQKDWFAVGIKWDSDYPSSGTLASLYPSESTNDPILIITYNTDLTYDNVGNLKKGLGEYHEYDSFNQLSRVRQKNATGKIIAEYEYDAEGNRVVKVEYNIDSAKNNRTTYYVDENYIQVRITNGTILNENYYHLNGKLVAKKDNSGNKQFYHPDHLGSTTLVTNQSGGIVEEEFYLPHGDVYSGQETSRFLHAGQELDKLVNLYLRGTRYYSTFTNIFIQPDKTIPDIYNPQYLNRYSYVLNNPYKYVDPSGKVAVYAGGLGQIGALVGAVGSTGIVITYSFSNGLQIGTYTRGGLGGVTTPTAGVAFEGGIAPLVNSLSEFAGTSYDVGFDVGEGLTGGGGISIPRDKAGNTNLKGIAIEGTFAPGTDANPLPIPASGYAGVSRTSVNCIFGCPKQSNSLVNLDKESIGNEIVYKLDYYSLYSQHQPYSTTQDPGPDGVIYAYGSRPINTDGGCGKTMSCPK